MRVTLDTNFLVSATQWDTSESSKLLVELLRRKVGICTSEEILEELVENARRAIGPDTQLRVNVSVQLVNEGKSSRCLINFCDNGPGISKHLRDRIFDDTYSNWPGQDHRGGLGLGFVRRVLEAHGGTVRVVDLSQGACFALEFDRFVVKK